MCNSWCLSFVHSGIKYFPDKPRIINIGSFDVNGTARDECEPLAVEYVGIDMRAGPGVDQVLNAENILEKFGKDSFDITISTELLEHVRNWPLVIYNMVQVLKPNGILLLTTRSQGFMKHGWPEDFWRFSTDDLIKIFEPMGEVLEVGSDPEVPGAGIIFRKDFKKITDKRYVKWLTQLKELPLFHIDLGIITFAEFEKREKMESEKLEKNKGKISLIMIVKDEEKVLERAVESVKSICDEIIICDTGSSDKTPEIISKYSEPHPLIFTNYVDTKNEALSLATSEFILFLDADEVVIEGLQFLKAWANSEGTNCVNAIIVEGIANGIPSNTYARARLWKNNNNWKFVGPFVHETLTSTGDSSNVTDHRILVLHDHSHRTPESYQIKFLGYIKLLKDYLQGHPNDSRANFYFARTHKDLGNFLDAIEYYRKYRALNSNFRDEIWQSFYDEALCWKELGEFDQCFEACDEAEKIDPRRAEIYVLQGQIYFDSQELDKAISAFEKAASIPVPTDVLLFENPRMHFELPRDYLVMLWDKKKNYREAYKNCKMLADKLPMPDGRQTHNLQWLNRMQYKNIFFCLGNTPEKVFGGMIDKVGVGGLETTYLEISEELAKRGHNCFLFANCEEEHIYKGTYYIPYTKIGEYANLKPDAIISSRWYQPFYDFPDAKKICWSQDNFYQDVNHPDIYQKADKIISSSFWHRNYLIQRLGLSIDSKKINVIPLSIRKELFQNKNIVKNPLKMLWSHNPNRGLDILMGMWEEISKQVPDIELTIAYGWEGLKTWSQDLAWIASIEKDKERIEKLAKDFGNIRITGRLSKAKLAEEQLSSSLELYSCNFWETQCLSALESQAAGCVMITSRLGALSGTLSNEFNILIDKNPTSKEYKEEFIRSVVELSQNEEKRKQMSDGCISYIEKWPTWKETAISWENLMYSI